MDEDDGLAVAVTLDASGVTSVLDDLEARSQRFGQALTGALKGATVGGKDLEETLRSVGNRLADIALSAGLKPLESALGSLVSGLTGSLGSLFTFADGGVPGRVTPFASGGVVSTPTYFNMGSDVGLMGEAGSEAILPLKRGSDGALGVASTGGTGTVIQFNVTASDAASFRKSEAQISAMLARTVRRGQRSL